MTTALLLVDVQRDALEPPRPVPAAAELRGVLQSLLDRARNAGAVIVHIQNDGWAGDPDEEGTRGWELIFPQDPGEPVVRKSALDAFADPSLATLLRARGVDRVLVAGTLSNYCVQATARGALRSGFRVQLISGAHATYDEQEGADILASGVDDELAREGIGLVSVVDADFGSGD